MSKDLFILERANGWYGGYVKNKNEYEQVFNTSTSFLFSSIKAYTGEGYHVICLDKLQEKEFMKDRITIKDLFKKGLLSCDVKR